MSDLALSLQALAIARSSEADDGIIAVYLHALDDLDPHLVRRACERLSKQPRAAYQAALPEVGAIREAAATIAREDRDAEQHRRLAPHIRKDDDPSTWVYCPDCADTGYRHFRCAAGVERGDRDSHLKQSHCGRRTGHSAHSYAERCPCWETNPELQKAWDRLHPKKTKAVA